MMTTGYAFAALVALIGTSSADAQRPRPVADTIAASTAVNGARQDTTAIAAESTTTDSSGRRPPETTHDFLMRTLGPVPIARSALVAGFEQWRDQPREWPDNARGYADRFGSRFGAEATGGALRFVLRHALHEQEADFTACACRGVAPRALHALATPFRAWSDSSARPHTSLLVPLTELGSGLLLTTFRPAGFRVGDGLRAGIVGLASLSAVSVVHEFWPWPWHAAERARRRVLDRVHRRHSASAAPNDSIARR